MPTTPFPTPLETLWQPRAIIAAMIAGEGLALVLALAPGTSSDRLVYFGLVSLMIQWIILSTLGLMYGLRHRLARISHAWLAWVALGLILLSTWLVGALVWELFRGTWLLTGESPWSFFLRLTGISLTLGLLALSAFQMHWRSKQLAITAEQAQLASLQARIQPHFLFNTLNTGIALAQTRPEATEQLLLDLSDLFRAALEGPRMTSLEAELELTRRYLEIEALRLGDRLRVSWEAPAPLPAVSIPRLSVQPLAENAIRHGVERIVSGGRVDILITSDEDWVHISVRNNLPEPGVPERSGHQVGLASVRERVEAMTGGRGQLQCRSEDKHYTVTLRVPLEASLGLDRPPTAGSPSPQVTTS